MSRNCEAHRLEVANALYVDFFQYTTVREVADVLRHLNLNVVMYILGILSGQPVASNVQEDFRKCLSVSKVFRLFVCVLIGSDDWIVNST